jgi:hypothetical protein
MLSSCEFKIGSSLSISSKSFSTKSLISGVISPFSGLISQDSTYSNYIFSSAVATSCAEPVYAKLFEIKTDGSLDDSNPIATQLIGADARYTFDLKALGLETLASTVQYVVRAEGCNGDVYKRPITNNDNSQNIDARTTVIAEVVNANSLVLNKLNEADRKSIESLINSVDGSNPTSAIASLTTNTVNVDKFVQIFGVSPTAIQDSKPEVSMAQSHLNLNELLPSTFSLQTFHIDPNYSFAYKWKLDGVVKSSSSSWTYIPTADSQGTHQIDVYVGKSDGSGNIDTTKPFYSKTLSISVNNNVLPTPPNWSLNASNPSPVNSNTLLVNIATGVSLANCNSFSHLAVTDTPAAPSVMQFNIECTTSGTQTESVTFSSGDGSRTLYLWAMDSEGTISSAKTLNVVLDTLPPVASLSFSPTIIRGGMTQSIPLSGSDAGVGLSSLYLYFSSNGGTSYSLISNLNLTDTSYSWSVPAIDTTNAIFKLVATDLTTSATTVYSNQFAIDSTAPSALAISRTSGASSNSNIVAISAICNADYDKVLYSQTGTTPTIADAAWENCNATKNFTTTTGDGLKTIYAFTKDSAGNISSSANVTMTLDTAAPGAPASSLASAGISSSTIVSFTVASCLDRPSILISESFLAPSAGDANWQTCGTGAGAMTYTLIGPVLQGNHDLYVYAKDAVGNISLSTAASMIYDTTNPTLNLSTTLASLYKGGDSVALNFTKTDINGLSSLKLYYANDGTTYSLINNLATSATSYTWTLPAHNTTTAKLKLEAIDNATTGNTSTIYSTTFTIDSTVPTAPTIARTSAQFSTSNVVAISTTCIADYQQILYTESASTPALADANWEACSATKSFTTGASDGAKTIYAFTRDLAGNISVSANVTMVLDTTLPTLSLTSFNASGFYQGGTSQNITWSASDTNITTTPISISYSADGSNYNAIVSNVANSGTYSWAIPSINSDTVTLKLTATDKAGNVRTLVSNNFTVDSAPPSVNTITITDNVTSISNRNVLVSMTASDAFTKLTSVCFRVNNNAQPAANDACWVSLDSIAGLSNAKNITITDFPLQLGTITGAYTVTGFVRDESNQISTLSNSGNGTNGVDLLTLNYTSNPAPTISNVLAVNVDTPSIPTTPQEQVAPLGSTVYIQWYASDNVALPANAIKIQYTTDDSVFVNVISNLTNGANGGCTVHAGYSGCYQLTNASPSSSFLRFKIIANDGDNDSSSVSNPLNTNAVNFLAGNTNHGIGGSAVSAIFTSYNEAGYNDYFDDRQLAVTKNGFAFVRSAYDDSILYIDPISGAVNYLVKKTGADTGDGGSVFTATLKSKSYLSLDHQDNLLIFNGDRIRKVDLHSNPWKITTLLGGGATVSSSTNPTLSPTAVSLSGGLSPSVATPNGRLYFFNGKVLSYYDYSDNLVHFVLKFNGLGATSVGSEDPNFDVNFCSVVERAIGFNISTSALEKIIARFTQTTNAACGSQVSAAPAIASFDSVTGTSTSPHPPTANWGTDLFSGLNGQIYALWHGRTTIKKYDKATNNWVTVLGSGNSGRCVDGTSALACNGIFMSAFVNSFGTLYVIDMGVVRYVDANGKIQTLFGQRRDFGTGYSPLSSRFSLLNSFALNGNDVYVMNTNERKITKFSLNGGNVTHIAGNSAAGSFAFGAAAATQPLTDSCGWSNSCMIQVDDLNHRLYFGRQASSPAYVDLNTGLWQQNVIGGSGVSANFLGINPADNKIFGYKAYSTTPFISSATFVLYDTNALTTTRIYGPAADTSTPASDLRICWDPGTATQLNTCDGLSFNLRVIQSNLMLTRVPFDTHDSTWKVTTRATNKIYSMPASGSSTLSLYTTTTSSTINSFDIYNDGVNPMIYYCGIDGKLYKKNVTSGVETNLPLPLASMTCAGSSIYYHAGRNSVIFSYAQNLLFGIAEYRNP